jgi:hypothetical protein
MTNSDFKIVKIEPYSEGRCVLCEASNYCNVINGTVKCKCGMTEHYINIKKERKLKLKKINESSLHK